MTSPVATASALESKCHLQWPSASDCKHNYHSGKAKKIDWSQETHSTRERYAQARGRRSKVDRADRRL